jgi:hypothetical protein
VHRGGERAILVEIDGPADPDQGAIEQQGFLQIVAVGREQRIEAAGSFGVAEADAVGDDGGAARGLCGGASGCRQRESKKKSRAFRRGPCRESRQVQNRAVTVKNMLNGWPGMPSANSGVQE